MDISRREFLKGAAAAFAASLVFPTAAFAISASAQPWTECPFEGENWTNCHNLRDSGQFPTASQAGRVVDVVVVGGGVSGMTATFRLRDLDVVLLDKGAVPGGNSRKGMWNGVDYPLGAMYIAKPEGHVTTLLQETGIRPILIPRPADSLHVDGHVANGLFEEAWKDLPYSKEVRHAWRDVCEHFAAYNEDPDAPPLPVEGAKHKQLRLDNLTFHEYMLDHAFHPEAMSLLDDYVRSDFGGDSKAVSAYVTVNFLASEFEPTYGFPGGNGGFTSLMAPLIAAHTQSGCFVHRVEEDGKYLRVSYVKDGAPHNLRTRAVIMATPQNIAVKVLDKVSDARLAAVTNLHYGCYMMGVIFLKAPVCDYAFDVWSRNRMFTDLCVADWIKTGGKPPKHRETVLVASIPMGQNAGRQSILKATHEELEERLLTDLEKEYPGSRAKVLGTQFARYGHPMILAGPGFVQNTSPILRHHEGNVFFAHSDIQGMPCFEAATWTGMQAARQARAALSSARAGRVASRSLS